LAAVINSTVFTALYNTIFHGVTVGGETYHYLPAFLHLVPVPEMGAVLAEQLENKVRAIQEDSNGNSVAWDELDRIIAAAYGVSETGRQALIAEHLERVGAASPTPESSGVSL
jgi:hypothetical protein